MVFTLAGYGQAQKVPVIYNKMASEFCTCVVSHHQGPLSQYLDPCMSAVIKENARGLMRLGLDSIHDGDMGRIGRAVMNVFKDKYPAVNSKIEEEMEKEVEKEMSMAQPVPVDIQ